LCLAFDNAKDLNLLLPEQCGLYHLLAFRPKLDTASRLEPSLANAEALSSFPDEIWNAFRLSRIHLQELISNILRWFTPLSILIFRPSEITLRAKCTKLKELMISVLSCDIPRPDLGGLESIVNSTASYDDIHRMIHISLLNPAD